MLSFLDYQRVFRVIYSTLQGTESAKMTTACLFYGVGGAVILKEALGLEARPVVGMAVYRVVEGEEGQNTIAFCESVEQPGGGHAVKATDRGWHCWVECDGVAYDFMSPMFKEIGASQGLSVPRRMFAKPLEAMASTLEELKRPGDFLLSSDPSMSKERLVEFADTRQYMDLVKIASSWFVPNPKKMARHIQIRDTKVGQVRWQLTDIAVDGEW